MAAPQVNQTVVVRGRPDDVRRDLLEVAGVGGYRLIGETPGGFALRRRRIPGWAIAVAVLFPIPGQPWTVTSRTRSPWTTAARPSVAPFMG